MANPRGPFRYDKSDYDDNGGIDSITCSRFYVSKISADNVDTTRWFRPRTGNSVWLRFPSNPSTYYEYRITLVYWYATYYSVHVTAISHSVCMEREVQAGPVTEWFLSWYDPSKPPPYDDTALSNIGVSVVESPTEPGSEIGCYLPYMDWLPPTYTRYVDAAGQEKEYWVEPQGLGHVVSVNDFGSSPPTRRLYVCTYFETLPEDEDMDNGSAPPFVLDYTWTPVDLDYPKIDKTTGKEYDPWGTLSGQNTIGDLATED